MSNPLIIQGGMGMGVSNWHLAKTVAQLGQLGVISGTAIDTIVARRLQDGDPGGHCRRALAHFPDQTIVQSILDAYFLPEGREPGQPYKNVGMFTLHPPKALLQMCVASNFVEVYLAREGHSGLIGINLLEKIRMPNLPSLYGAMLAGVDYVLMGAGIPREIPAALDRLANHEPARLRMPVEGAPEGSETFFDFDPKAVLAHPAAPLKRPKFFPIVGSAVLAMSLGKKVALDGFIVEGPLAGGHNAPPRGDMRLSERGEPIYGPRDVVDLEKIRALGFPFYLAGFKPGSDKLQQAIDAGACGVQIGTPFAFCEESGVCPEVRAKVLELVRKGEVDVFTDPRVSPTGFPFKVVQVEGSISGADVYAERPRICDLGYLRLLYQRPDGSVGYRCPGEPVDTFVKKGGAVEETEGRKCLCNGLQAVIGLGQTQEGDYEEPPLITAGEALQDVGQFLKPGASSYSAKDVIDFYLAGLRQPQAVSR